MPVRPDREKYLKIAKSAGISAAITALHLEMEALEMECFEGKNGYRPDLYEDIKTFRNFSRELWELQFDSNYSQHPADQVKY